MKRRRESLVELFNGATVYPSVYDDYLFRNPGIIDFDISLDRSTNRLIFEVETKKDGDVRKEQVETPIRESMVAMDLTIEEQLLPQGSLKQGARFKKMIEEV